MLFLVRFFPVFEHIQLTCTGTFFCAVLPSVAVTIMLITIVSPVCTKSCDNGSPVTEFVNCLVSTNRILWRIFLPSLISLNLLTVLETTEH
jgi:hypothetical protein